MEPKDFAGVTNALEAEDSKETRRHKERRHLTFLRAQLEAIGRNDFESVLAAAALDVALDIFAPPEFKWIFSARGVGELRRALAENFGSLVDQKPVITNVIAQHDTIVLFGREPAEFVRQANATMWSSSRSSASRTSSSRRFESLWRSVQVNIALVLLRRPTI